MLVTLANFSELKTDQSPFRLNECFMYLIDLLCVRNIVKLRIES